MELLASSQCRPLGVWKPYDTYSLLEKHLLACCLVWQKLYVQPLNISEYVTQTAHYELGVT